jgi:hypothetical protein
MTTGRINQVATFARRLRPPKPRLYTIVRSNAELIRSRVVHSIIEQSNQHPAADDRPLGDKLDRVTDHWRLRPRLLFASRALVARPGYSRHGRVRIETRPDRVDRSRLRSLKTYCRAPIRRTRPRQPKINPPSANIARLSAGNLLCRPTAKGTIVVSPSIAYSETARNALTSSTSIQHAYAHIRSFLLRLTTPLTYKQNTSCLTHM